MARICSRRLVFNFFNGPVCVFNKIIYFIGNTDDFHIYPRQGLLLTSSWFFPYFWAIFIRTTWKKKTFIYLEPSILCIGKIVNKQWIVLDRAIGSSYSIKRLCATNYIKF